MVLAYSRWKQTLLWISCPGFLHPPWLRWWWARWGIFTLLTWPGNVSRGAAAVKEWNMLLMSWMLLIDFALKNALAPRHPKTADTFGIIWKPLLYLPKVSNVTAGHLNSKSLQQLAEHTGMTRLQDVTGINMTNKNIKNRTVHGTSWAIWDLHGTWCLAMQGLQELWPTFIREFPSMVVHSHDGVPEGKSKSN